MSAADDQPLPVLLEAFLERLADELADRVQQRLAQQTASAEPRARRLLSLDELVAHLPAGKKPETWRRWLYQRTRLGQVPGCVKLGGRLFFDRELTLPWLENGCTHGRLDLPGEESLHDPMTNGRDR
jgi:hypothetical protein